MASTAAATRPVIGPARELLLGDGAIALGLLEAGVDFFTGYPGTPATEVLEEAVRLAPRAGHPVHAEWSVNEKVAFDVAFAATLTGRHAAVVMKQVGLNVAADSLFSTAYTGVLGGLVIVVADDPGPHSSQTEQDTRFYALAAKVPVLDPATPREAREMAREAVALSARSGLPVLLRPTLRVCHARQPIAPEPFAAPPGKPRFRRDVARWAATPRERNVLHRLLNRRGEAVRDTHGPAGGWNRIEDDAADAPLGIIAGGAAYAVLRDVLREAGARVPVLKVGLPVPFPDALVRRFVEGRRRVLVLEEPGPVLETLLGPDHRVWGRRTGHVPSEGELTPDRIAASLRAASLDAGLPPIGREAPADEPDAPAPRPPTLCAGCGHRSAFRAIREEFRRAIFPSDIGCYTLGIAQGAVDTCLTMGASLGVAAGLAHALRADPSAPAIVATIGDSTFFHAGIPPLLDAVTTGARFVAVILDNGAVAMTGGQPTPASRDGADGRAVPAVTIRRLVEACGVRHVAECDPFDDAAFRGALRAAAAHVAAPDGGVAVVIARRPCALLDPPAPTTPVTVTDACTGCGACIVRFGCPALVADPVTGVVHVELAACLDCGACIPACPEAAIVPALRGGRTP